MLPEDVLVRILSYLPPRDLLRLASMDYAGVLPEIFYSGTITIGKKYAEDQFLTRAPMSLTRTRLTKQEWNNYFLAQMNNQPLNHDVILKAAVILSTMGNPTTITPSMIAESLIWSNLKNIDNHEEFLAALPILAPYWSEEECSRIYSIFIQSYSNSLTNVRPLKDYSKALAALTSGLSKEERRRHIKSSTAELANVFTAMKDGHRGIQVVHLLEDKEQLRKIYKEFVVEARKFAYTQDSISHYYLSIMSEFIHKLDEPELLDEFIDCIPNSDDTFDRYTVPFYQTWIDEMIGSLSSKFTNSQMEQLLRKLETCSNTRPWVAYNNRMYPYVLLQIVSLLSQKMSQPQVTRLFNLIYRDSILSHWIQSKFMIEPLGAMLPVLDEAQFAIVYNLLRNRIQNPRTNDRLTPVLRILSSDVFLSRCTTSQINELFNLTIYESTEGRFKVNDFLMHVYSSILIPFWQRCEFYQKVKVFKALSHNPPPQETKLDHASHGVFAHYRNIAQLANTLDVRNPTQKKLFDEMFENVITYGRVANLQELISNCDQAQINRIFDFVYSGLKVGAHINFTSYEKMFPYFSQPQRNSIWKIIGKSTPTLTLALCADFPETFSKKITRPFHKMILEFIQDNYRAAQPSKVLPKPVTDLIVSYLPLRDQMNLGLITASGHLSSSEIIDSATLTQSVAQSVFHIPQNANSYQGRFNKKYWMETLREQMGNKPTDHLFNLRAAAYLSKLRKDATITPSILADAVVAHYKNQPKNQDLSQDLLGMIEIMHPFWTKEQCVAITQVLPAADQNKRFCFDLFIGNDSLVKLQKTHPLESIFIEFIQENYLASDPNYRPAEKFGNKCAVM